MPPRTRSSQQSDVQSKEEPKHQRQSRRQHDKDEDAMDVDEKEELAGASEDDNPKKRKSPPTAPPEPEEKAPKKTGKGRTKDSANNKSGPSTRQLLNYLLSEDAISLCYPDDDIEAAKSGKFPKTYSMTPPSSFTPFENLLVAHLLSKPLSHVLGLRSIRTILNPPFTLSKPETIAEAGEKRVWEALEEARTQHRQKTAAYIYETAQAYTDDDTMFKLAEEANDDGFSGVISHIKDTVNGMGETGAQIFCRRIQCVDGWGDAVWPYADPRAMESLHKLGLDVKDADQLESLVEEHVDWQKVGQMGLQRLTGTGREAEVERKDDTGDDTGKVEDMDMDQRIQVEFVVLLERAVGAVLQGNTEKVRQAASQY